MVINYQDIITLDDDNKYVVASKVNYKGSTYLYLVDINDTTNYKFAELENNNILSELDNEIDEDLIKHLIPLFYKSSKNDIKIN